jgi:hypothetical protein
MQASNMSSYSNVKSVSFDTTSYVSGSLVGLRQFDGNLKVMSKLTGCKVMSTSSLTPVYHANSVSSTQDYRMGPFRSSSGSGAGAGMTSQPMTNLQRVAMQKTMSGPSMNSNLHYRELVRSSSGSNTNSSNLHNIEMKRSVSDSATATNNVRRRR